MAEIESTSETDARRIYDQMKAQPAAITKAQMRELEEAFQDEGWGIARRIGLAVLTEPCAKVFEQVGADRSLAVAMAGAERDIGAYIDLLDAFRDALTDARNRITMGLCVRDDMAAVLAEAEAGSRG
ncbi:MAG TPA: hypothetical protein PK359_15325 [Burkholderiaceae bacterium]|nr:hypothetical protein [Burkholderiaceae bacterium]